MKTLSDEELLREYVATGSDPAFTELVKRYSNLVQSIAAQMVDWDSAKDISQRVFLTLAKKAGQVEGPVDDWLRCTTFHYASGLALSARRRENREQAVVSVNERLANGAECNWEAIRPHLEPAMQQLDVNDRRIITLRYYLKLSQRAVAEKLGISEDALESRTRRALDRLRDYFTRHGISTSTSGLAILLTANAVQAAPAGLVASIVASVAAAKAATAATAASSIAASTRMLTMGTLKNALVGASLVGMLSFALFKANDAHKERAAKAQLAQQLTEQLDAKDRKLEELQRQLTVQAQRPQFQAPDIEVLRLRRENAALRARPAAAPMDAIQNASLQAWLKRSTNLQLRAAGAAEMKIPELGLVIEDDWLDAARNLSETDKGYLKAFSRVRELVEGKFAAYVYGAVKKHMAASAGQFPTDIVQLAAHFDPPLDPAMLTRWRVVPVLEDDLEETPSGRIIRLTPMNANLDMHWAVDENGPRSALLSVTRVSTEGAQ